MRINLSETVLLTRLKPSFATRFALLGSVLSLGLGGLSVADTVYSGGSHTVSGGGAAINGGGNGGYFVQSGTVTFQDATFIDFSATGGDGSGGGAGMGGVVFVNSGASVILKDVNFYANGAKGGDGGIGTKGGTLNGITSPFVNPTSNGTTGTAGGSGTPADAYLNSGDGRDGFNGSRGGNATNGFGGQGGTGGNGSDGSMVTLDNVSAAFDIAKSTYEALEDTTEATIYTALSTSFAAQAAAALAGVNVGGPTTAHLAPIFTALSVEFATLATKATASVAQAAVDAVFESAKLVALETTVYQLGLKGNGGSGGAAGSGGTGSFAFGGGAGGDGGLGGNAASLSGAIGGSGGDGGDGGEGGFGGGGGGGGAGGGPGSDGLSATNYRSYGASGVGGLGGFGGGNGYEGGGDPALRSAGGNGGAGFGGAIFIRDGGSVTIQGNVNFAGNSVMGGSGQNDANGFGQAGLAVGSDIFMMKGATLILDAGDGNVISFNGTSGSSIADDSRASMNATGVTSPIQTGNGAGVTILSGLVKFNNSNLYTGQTLIAGGVLQAQDGEGIHLNSNINLAGGVLQSHGSFTRFLGTASDRVQWTGSGGFAAAGGDLNVNLNGGLGLTWGSGNFVQAGSALIFGSTSATDSVYFKNAIDLAGGARTILVRANASNDDIAYLEGVISNGSLVVGDSTHRGTLVLMANNTYAGGTTVNYGTLALGAGGSLNSNGAVTIQAPGAVDVSLAGDQAIGDLTGAGTVLLGSTTLTINQSGNTTFSGSLNDGGVGGGIGGGIVKNLGGTLTLSGTNGYTGKTDLRAGKIVLDGTLASLEVVIASGATLENNSGGLDSASALVNNGTLDLNANDAVTSLVNTGTINNSANTLTAQTYALNSGSIVNANLGSGAATANGFVAINGTIDASTVTIASGTTTLGSADRLLDTVALTIDSGANLNFGGSEKIGELYGAGNLRNGGGLVTVDSGDFSGVISGTGGLTKVSSGTLKLTGGNTYTGATRVDAGTLELSGAGSLVSDSVTIASGATFDDLNGGLDLATTVTNDGTFNIAGVDDTITELINTGTVNGTATLTALNYRLNSGSTINANLGTGTVYANGAVALNGTSNAENFNVQTGVTTLGSAERLRNDGIVAVSAGAELVLGGDEKIGTLNGAGTVDLESSRLTVDSGIFSGVIEGTGGLTKVSTGTLTLSGAETYTGSTLVEAGLLELTGSLTGPTVKVSAGATLDDINAGLADGTEAEIDGTLAVRMDEKIDALTGTGSVILDAAKLTLNRGDFSGVISGTGPLNKISSGTLKLTGANTYTGATTIDAGILELSGAGSLLSDSIAIASGATLDDLNGGLDVGATVTNDGTFNIAGVDDTITELINTGTVNGTATLTALNYRLNSGSTINANLGTGTVYANGAVALNGTSNAENFNVQTGVTTLGSAERLRNDGIVAVSAGAELVLGGDEKIGVLNGAGTVDLENSRLTVDSGIFSGVIEGSGGLTKVSTGTLTLSGAETYTGSTLVEAGLLELTGSLTGTTVKVSAGATLDDINAGLADGTEAEIDGVLAVQMDEKIDALTGTGSVILDAANLTLNRGDFSGILSGSGSLEKLSSGTLKLTGVNTYAGATEVKAGILELSGSGSLASTPVTISSGARLNNLNGGLSAAAVVNNHGTLHLGLVDDTILGLVNSGTVSGSATLTAATYQLNNGSVINANLGTGVLTTSGNVILNGTSLADTVNIPLGSILSLGAAERLADTATVNLDGTLTLGGNETISVLNGAGVFNINTFKLVVTHGGTFAGTINARSLIGTGGDLILDDGATSNTDDVTSTGGGTIQVINGSTVNTGIVTIQPNSSLLVGSGGTLNSLISLLVQPTGSLDIENGGSVLARLVTVSGGGIINLSGGYTFSYETLTGNGFVDTHGGQFTNAPNSTVSGNLTFSNDFRNTGTLAPGNSPGRITILGNYTEAGLLLAEIQHSRSSLGHDQIRVGGTIHIESSSRLIVQAYKGEKPKRGETYQILSDLNGNPLAVTGTFKSLRYDADGVAGPRPARQTTALVFDRTTGQVIATGLDDTQSFADLGRNRNERAVAGALFGAAQVGKNQIETSDQLLGGSLRDMLIGSADPGHELAFFAPVIYGGMADYAKGGDAGLTDLVRARVTPLASKNASGAYAGYRHFRMNSNDNIAIERNDGYIGGDFKHSSGAKLGALFSFNEGTISDNFGHGRATGQGGILYGEGKIAPRWSLFGDLGVSSNDFRMNRQTHKGFVSADASADGFAAAAGIRYHAIETEGFSLLPHFVLGHESADVAGFAERGALDALRHGGYKSDRFNAELGASAVWETELAGRSLDLELIAGLRQTLSESDDGMTATLVNDGRVSYPVGYESSDSTRFSIGANAGYEFLPETLLYLGYEGIFGSGESINRANAGMRRNF